LRLRSRDQPSNHRDQAGGRNGETGCGRGVAHEELYAQIQRQAALLAYMDQYRMFGIMLACLLPLVLFLKRPPRLTGKIELEAH
jgi:hypothetical protein